MDDEEEFSPASRAAVPERVRALRAELARRGLAGFVVPRADEHQGEYVPPSAQRLAWLTGFTGSAGAAVLLAEEAAIFVDGRYTLQVRQETLTDLFAPQPLHEMPPARWIEQHLPAGGRLGYDPWLHTETEVERLEAGCRVAGGELVAVADNPLDAVWSDRPPPPAAPVEVHPLERAGRSAEEKRREIAEALAREKVDAAVLTAPDSIAWLLNIRGGDVAHTPLPLAFAILHADACVDLYIDPRKISAEVAAHLGNAVALHPPEAFVDGLAALAGRSVRADAGSAPVEVFRRLAEAGARPMRGPDPCQLPKACKNEVELAGARAAHARDAVALARFLAWLDREAPTGRIGEIEAAARLLAFRREVAGFRDTSFPSISGAGPNGAIVHYRASRATERNLGPGMLYLIDSGAQYPDGTTDVTRTIVIGEPTAEARERFTRVLKGHIALATVRFPRGTNGGQLDGLARRALWEVGLDYDHGTGHGVGSYLSVHEGPQRIARMSGGAALEPGMIVSNEPGYYKAGAYGIRIENLLAVRVAALPGAEREMLEFETLTLAPIDLRLVEPALLAPPELAWLDAYHARVREAVGPSLDAATRAWLEQATRPIG